MKSRAFTLIERIAAIVIIGILAAILSPVIAIDRDTARQAICGSNIRQVSLAILMYADDNNGIMPTTGSTPQGEQSTDWILWRADDDRINNGVIVPYLGNVFTPELYRCPADERIADRLDELGSSYSYAFSYSMNRALDPQNPGRWGSPSIRGRIAEVPDPSRIIFMVEESSPNDSSAWLEHTFDELTERHGGLGHVTFLDGSLKRVTRDFAKHQMNWDPLWDGRGAPNPQ